jgi:hypothetical protein
MNKDNTTSVPGALIAQQMSTTQVPRELTW